MAVEIAKWRRVVTGDVEDERMYVLEEKVAKEWFENGEVVAYDEV